MFAWTTTPPPSPPLVPPGWSTPTVLSVCTAVGTPAVSLDREEILRKVRGVLLPAELNV